MSGLQSIKILLVCFALLVIPVPLAYPQVQIIWENQGQANDTTYTDGSVATVGGIDMTTNWYTVTDGGTFIPGSASDFVTINTGSIGAQSGNLYLSFENDNDDPDDKIILDFTFSQAVTELSFSILDIDYDEPNDLQDFIEVEYHTGDNNWVNLTTQTALWSLGGTALVRDNELFGEGWEGDLLAASGSVAGNLDIDFGVVSVKAFRVRYFSGDDEPNPNTFQETAISDLSFQPPGPALDGERNVTVYDPNNDSLLLVPGNDAISEVTITHIGSSPVTVDSIEIVIDIPVSAVFYNGDIDDAGPETNPIIFEENSPTGLTFTYVSDARFSTSVTEPAYADCNYTPGIGYDAAVTFVCLNPKGVMIAGSPDPSFTISFRQGVN